jgi:hypothetical protein
VGTAAAEGRSRASTEKHGDRPRLSVVKNLEIAGREAGNGAAARIAYDSVQPYQLSLYCEVQRRRRVWMGANPHLVRPLVGGKPGGNQGAGRRQIPHASCD